ncbi:Heptaprenyl diphosphate synthase component I [Alteracholeplasma palmae J233]|uniref:Heptaprenyl diphosphate synthase component I n=1 Tax=Alteracholeplasma palmae (strain ATCC 49389 / J233) TaxID=1318466 RepID=U4KSE9_ALTPJ|nr:Gx transporter family protein [Alteracholeplasma palmae]CCV64946.1 Heptaprenyl diphosphate synthase component I [Alteracholeplasma palmae J233]
MKDLKKMVILSNLLAISIILSILEGFYPIIPVPSAKIGFANIITLLVFYMYGFKEAFIITIFRVVLVALLSRSFSITFMMGLAGGILSVIVMQVIKKLKFNMITVSVMGSIFHAIGQILIGTQILATTILYLYLPVMLLTSIPAGILTGIISLKLLKTGFIQSLQKSKKIVEEKEEETND